MCNTEILGGVNDPASWRSTPVNTVTGRGTQFLDTETYSNTPSVELQNSEWNSEKNLQSEFKNEITTLSGVLPSSLVMSPEHHSVICSNLLIIFDYGVIRFYSSLPGPA